MIVYTTKDPTICNLAFTTVSSLFWFHYNENKSLNFQEFLSSIAKYPELCLCKLLKEFLPIGDEEEFWYVRKLNGNDSVPTS